MDRPAETNAFWFCGAQAFPTVRFADFDSAAYVARSHEYINVLHASLGTTFLAEVASANGPTTLFTCDAALCDAVLRDSKRFSPARCPDHAFSSPAGSSVSARSSFDLVQPMARGTVFDIGGDRWKAHRKCLGGTFAIHAKTVQCFDKATGDILDRWHVVALAQNSARGGCHLGCPCVLARPSPFSRPH